LSRWWRWTEEHEIVRVPGDAPVEECTLTSIRDPQTITRLVSIDRGNSRGGGKGDVDLVPVVLSKSISVSLDCTH
jgi:hypothetical protein